MATKEEKGELKITAPTSWWKRMTKALMLSSEKSNDTGDTTSFLSCVLVNGRMDGSLSLSSESGVSKTHVLVKPGDEKIDSDGEGKFMVKASDLLNCVNSLPEDDVSAFFDGQYVVIETSDGRIKYKHPLVSIFSHDSTPQTQHSFDDNSLIITCSGEEFVRKYRAAQTMSYEIARDQNIQLTPLNSCVMSIEDSGLQMFSIASCSSEAYIDEEVEYVGNRKNPVKSVLSFTHPEHMTQRISMFSENKDIRVGIGDNMNVHIEDDYIHMEIAKMNILNLNLKENKMTVDRIMNLVEPLWKNRIVTVEINAKEFFGAFSRASKSSDSIVLEITDTEILMRGRIKDSNEVPFKQSLDCSTQWHDDDAHKQVIGMRLEPLSLVAPVATSLDTLKFTISVQDVGNTESYLVTMGFDEKKDYDPEDPHNFFIMPTLNL